MGYLRRTLVPPPPVVPAGQSQAGFGLGEASCQTFINLFKAWQAYPSTGNNPSTWDADGYPKAPFTGAFGGQIMGFTGSPLLLSAGPFVISWPATRAVFRLRFLSSANVVSQTGSPTVINGSGSGNFTIENTS